jgi:hypothetical protein
MSYVNSQAVIAMGLFWIVILAVAIVVILKVFALCFSGWPELTLRRCASIFGRVVVTAGVLFAVLVMIKAVRMESNSVVIGDRDVLRASIEERVRRADAVWKYRTQMYGQHSQDFPDEAATRSDRGPKAPLVAWHPSIEQTFEITGCPSLISASRVLSQRVLTDVKKLLPQDDGEESTAATFRILIEGSRAHGMIAEEIADALRKQYPQASLEFPKKELSGQSNNHTIDIRVQNVLPGTEQVTTFGAGDQPWPMHVIVRVDGLRGQTRHPLAIDQKDWVDDQVSGRLHEGLIVVGSEQLASSVAEAMEQSSKAASELLLPALVATVKVSLHVPVRPSDAAIEGRVRQHLESALKGPLLRDRFAQQLSRPYGTVWREARLVSADVDQLMPIVDRTVRELFAEQSMRFSQAAALVLFLGVLTLIYYLLDWITRGYNRRRITVALSIVAVGGVVLLLNIA